VRAARARKPLIRVALVESDPLRVVGFRAFFDAASGFELVSASLRDGGALQSIDLVLLSNCRVQNRVDLIASLKGTRPDLRIIMTGSGDEKTILQAIVAGAKGYVDEAASPAEFVQAVRVVSQGSVWAPRHVFSMFIERASYAPARSFPAGPRYLHRPGEGSPGVAGRGPLQQGNRVPPRHSGADGESSRGQADAEGRRAESYRALGSRPYTLASYRKIEVEHSQDCGVSRSHPENVALSLAGSLTDKKWLLRASVFLPTGRYQ